jgi:uncharacterized protein (DUF1800 family)
MEAKREREVRGALSPLGWRLRAALLVAAVLAGCSGSDSEPAGDDRGDVGYAGPTTQLDAVRLAHQATFGPSEASVDEIVAMGAGPWVVAQLSATGSQYRLGGDDAPDKNTSRTDFCDLPAQQGNPNCRRDYHSSEPLLWDFYRNAVRNPDQLRQRVALALGQLLVISNLEVDGTYGLRRYHNTLLDGAFGNYRDLLRQVIRSPMMGLYLDHVNNAAASPNENFARELLQLFSIGPCALAADGTLQGGRCQPTYDNAVVREYAYALTGWTFPPGGADRSGKGCRPEGANCRYLGGDMVPAGGALRDTQARTLLAGVGVPAGTPAPAALEKVLDSLMAHPNIAPFVGRHLIQHLVTANPTPAYVGRVAAAFNAGRFHGLGGGTAGDLAATVAAVLLDDEARSVTPGDEFGRLREPIQMFTGPIRAIGGDTDGAVLGPSLGRDLAQHAFRPPSVFNFYRPDAPLAGTSLAGGAFGIHNASTALNRLNYLTLLLDKGGADPVAGIPGAVGTYLVFDTWLDDADDPPALVDRLALVSSGRTLPEPARGRVIEAVNHHTERNNPNDWRERRVRSAAWLVLSAPQTHIAR